MQALKAFLDSWFVRRFVCWVIAVWLWAGPPAAQDGPEAAEEASSESSPVEVEPDWNLSPSACVGYDSPTCLDSGYPSSYFDGPWRCECGVDTRMYRSLFLARLWVEAEYLAWASSKTHLPPLLTTGSPATPPDQAGVLGRPDTVILFGDADLHGDLRSGGRLTGGYWFTPEHRCGVEGSFFEVDVGDTEYLASGHDFPVLARPIVDAQTGLPGRVLVSHPDLELGTALVRSDVDFLGAEALLRRRIHARQGHRLDGVAGYRYQRLYDGLQVDGRTGSITEIELRRFDNLESENEFHGGEVGLIGRWWGHRWALQVLGKAAFGDTRTTATIDGSTAVTYEVDGEPTTYTRAGGVLAQGSNIGRYTQSELTAAGELGIRVEYAVTHQLYVTCGYTFIYWPQVCRVTDGIDLTVDPSQVPPEVNPAAVRPGFAFRSSDFWAQGLSLGLHYEF